MSMVTHGATQNIKNLLWQFVKLTILANTLLFGLTRLSFPVIVRRRLQFSKLFLLI